MIKGLSVVGEHEVETPAATCTVADERPRPVMGKTPQLPGKNCVLGLVGAGLV
jgi:hypothetical protein